jgi:hypothetical protein
MRRYTLEAICLLALAAGAASAQESAAQKRASAEEVFQTIRSDDMSALRQLVSNGAANVKDKLSMSALHYIRRLQPGKDEVAGGKRRGRECCQRSWHPAFMGGNFDTR